MEISDSKPKSDTKGLGPCDASASDPLCAPILRVNRLEDRYEILEQLGSGMQGVVLRCRRRDTGEERAVKVICKETGGKASRQTLRLVREAEILRRCRHPNIMGVSEVLDSPGEVSLVMDLVEGGDLFDYLVRTTKEKQEEYEELRSAERPPDAPPLPRPSALTEQEAAKIVKELLLAVEYLHAASPPMVHRDIKPENVLVELRPDGRVDRVRLSDFGLAKPLIEPNPESTPIGTTFYLPPEVLDGMYRHGSHPRPSNIPFMKSLDIWSLGVVFYILLCGSPPFMGSIRRKEECQQLLGRIQQGVKFPPHKFADVSEEAKDLVLKMLQIDPNARITASQALVHPWIASGGGSETIELATPSVLASEYTDKSDFSNQTLFSRQGGRAAAVAAAAGANEQAQVEGVSQGRTVVPPQGTEPGEAAVVKLLPLRPRPFQNRRRSGGYLVPQSAQPQHT